MDKLPEVRRKATRWFNLAAVILVNILVVFVLLESFFIFSISFPFFLRFYPSRLKIHIQYLHKNYERQVPTFDPRTAVYSKDFHYLLKPGTFTLKSREFKNNYMVNRLGVRDDEESLQAPAVVVLGDSFANGYGVNQDQMFSEIIQRKTGLKALNASVISFGTVREMRVLDFIDTSNLKYLILQYCNNDFVENKIFFINGNRLLVSGEEVFRRTGQNYLNDRQYYFGRFCVETINKVLGKQVDEQIEAAAEKFRTRDKYEIGLFINALIKTSQFDLSKLEKIIIFDLEADGKMDRQFAPLLAKHIALGKYPVLKEKVTIIDTALLLGKDNFYQLDGHMNAQGNEILADAIIDALPLKRPTGV